MTATEQALIPALGVLRGATPMGLVRLLVQGLAGSAALPDEQARLTRMALDQPGTFKEKALRALMLGAIRRSG